MTTESDYKSAVESGYLALMQGETEQALDHCTDAARLQPHGLLHVFVLALASMALRDIGRAIKFMEEGHRRAPNTKEFADALAALHARVGNMSESVYFAKLVMVMDSDPELAEIMPEEFSDLEKNLEYASVTPYLVDAAIAFHERDYRKAIDLCSRELAVQPDNAECYRLQGRACIELHEYDTGIDALRRAVALEPGEPEGDVFLGDALLASGAADDAISAYREGIGRAPDNIELRNRLINSQAYATDEVWASRLEELDELSDRLREGGDVEPARAVFPSSSDQLVVGFLINEYARANTLRFAEGIFRNYDKSRLKIVVYQQHSQPAPSVMGLIRLVDDWRQTYDIDDETLDLIIRNDGIQVLVDLCGLQPGHRQSVLAGGAAPARVNWLGFPYVRVPATADALFTDDFGAELHGAAKEVVSLGACQFAFGGGTMDLETGVNGVSPHEANGFVTFGAALDPVNIEHSAQLWLSVLRRLPDIRLHFGGRGMVHPETRGFIAARFDDPEVRDRISVGDNSAGASSLAEFLAAIDVMLDPVHASHPMLICDAMWMGVPVVSLLGDRPAARLGGSVLNAANRSDLLASDFETYVEICAGLAGDRPALTETRQSLREQISASPLCDIASFTRHFEGALAQVHREFS